VGIIIDISLTDIVKSAIYASINGISVFLSIRYLGRIVDRVDHKKNDNKNCNKGDDSANGKA
jgi:hypothetical protein